MNASIAGDARQNKGKAGRRAKSLPCQYKEPSGNPQGRSLREMPWGMDGFLERDDEKSKPYHGGTRNITKNDVENGRFRFNPLDSVVIFLSRDSKNRINEP
jgi:hypothetical protein